MHKTKSVNDVRSCESGFWRVPLPRTWSEQVEMKVKVFLPRASALLFIASAKRGQVFSAAWKNNWRDCHETWWKHVAMAFGHDGGLPVLLTIVLSIDSTVSPGCRGP